MATTTTAVGRATAELTGSDTIDYGADLDMQDTVDGWVGVKAVLTKGSSDEVTFRLHAGSSANPTDIMFALSADGTVSSGDGTITGAIREFNHILTGSSVTFYVEVRCSARYFRASAAAGGTATSSDAVITYHYRTGLSLTPQDGGQVLS